MDITNPFNSFDKSAFRLEGLPEYKVEDEADPLEYFKAHGSIQPGFGNE